MGSGKKKLTAYQRKVIPALKKSIDHWVRLRDGTQGPEERTGTADCALCGLFFYDLYCRGCPVQIDTNQTCCDGSPYERARDEFLAAKNNVTTSTKNRQEEITYLRDLLRRVRSGDLQP